MIVETTIIIEAPVERVWELTTDVESHPKYTPTMTSIERLDPGPLSIGSSARIKQPAQRAKIWTVTKLDPNRRFVWCTKSTGMTMTGTHLLEPSAGGTKATLSIELTGPVGRIVGPLLRRPIRRAIETENHGFKTAAEAP